MPQLHEQLDKKAERSFEDRREELFWKIEAISDRFTRRDICCRVFEHSTEDGLQLAERLRLTPQEVRTACINVPFILKHPDIYKTIEGFKVDEKKGVLERQFEIAKDVLKRYVGRGVLTEAGERDLHDLQARNKGVPLIKSVDDLYLDLLLERQLLQPVSTKERPKRPAEPSTRSKGEVAGERYLKDIEEVLERRYYTGPLKTILKKYNTHVAEDLILNDPSIREWELRTLLNVYHIVDDAQVEIFNQLEPARVVAYRQLDSLKRGAVTTELLKEIRKELPEGSRVERNEKTGLYQIVEFDTDGKKRETKTTAEYLKEFDEYAMDQIEELMRQGATMQDVLPGLAGLNTPRAWKIREDALIADSFNLSSLILGLAGVDSPRAWKLRKLALDTRPLLKMNVARSLTGLDTPEAWEMRERLEKTNLHFGHIIESLIGVNSQRALETRLRSFRASRSGMAVSVAKSLTGVDSPQPEVDELRNELKEMYDSSVHDTLLISLAGLDSPKINAFREELLGQHYVHRALLEGYAGNDSEKAWNEREGALGASTDLSSVAHSLVGLHSPHAEKMRKDLSDAGVHFGALAQSFAGTYNTFVWRLQPDIGKRAAAEQAEVSEGRLVKQIRSAVEAIDSMDPDYFSKLEKIAVDLVGLDSAPAHQLRGWLLTGQDIEFKKVVALTLIGLDSDWSNALRQELQRYRVSSDTIANSLAGLNSPLAKMRCEELLKTFNAEQGRDGKLMLEVNDDAVDSMLGGYELPGPWKTRLEQLLQKRQSNNAPTGIQSKLDLLNLVNHPNIGMIQRYWQEHPQPLITPEEQKKADRKRFEQNPFACDVFGMMLSDRDAARDFLETNPAVPDRAPERLARELIRRMLPGYHERTISQRVGEFFGITERPSPAGAVLDRPSFDLIGGGSEGLSDKRRVLESRDPMNELLVTGIYGAYNKGSRRWEKVYFPVPERTEGATRETTLTLESVSSGTRVVLPMPLDGALIKERVKGVSTKGMVEIPLETTTNSLGETTTEVTLGIDRVSYSIERPLAPQPMKGVGNREFEQFVARFSKENGTGTTEPLARLPRDIESRLRSPAFRKLQPKEKVEYIESMVRELGWYDVKNEETREEKRGATPEEQIVICEERIEKLRRRHADSGMKGKRFAGVCADFASITCAALRFAGIPAGILTGLNMNGKEAQMRHSHATAFVPWPDGFGGIRVISVDGTPNGTTPETANIARPSISERERRTKKEFSAELKMAREVLDEALRAAQADDEEALKGMQNGKLEWALNLILHHEVKTSHLQAIEEMLNVYWYGGLEKQESIVADVTLRQTLESAIASQRKSGVDQLAEDDAGTKLLESVRSFIEKFQKGRKSNRAQAFQVTQHLAEIAGGELSSVERRALIATIAYLKAEKMG